MSHFSRGLFFASAILATHAHAFVVTNTNDHGEGSLRQAIIDANAISATGCDQQTITFNIPGSGIHTIQPTSPLPLFNISIVLDGYSQTGSKANTSNNGTNAVITIELDGSNAGTSNGIVIGYPAPMSGVCGGDGSRIDGIVINRFSLAGVEMSESPCPMGYQCEPIGAQIYGSFIGTDTSGMSSRPNGGGVHLGFNSKSAIIGEARVGLGGETTPIPQTRNIISANTGSGVLLESNDAGSPSLAHTIRNNLIGVDATGTHALPNGGYGILADAGSSSEVIQDNLIAGQPADGVRIVGGTSISVTYNAIGVGIGGVALGNSGDGIHVQGAHGVTVGFGYPSLDGLGIASIANNGGAGVYAEGVGSVDVTYGSIAKNGGLGIDLAPRGVNPNDVLDGDNGPNELLNSPVLQTATYDAHAMSPPTTINGTIDTTPNAQVEIDFYVSEFCDPSGYGEGEGYVGYMNVTTDASGHAPFTQSNYVHEGMAITALSRRFSSTDPALIVSEFSNCLVIGDAIFANGFGP